MKKISFLMMLILCMMVSFVGCTTGGEGEEPVSEDVVSEGDTEEVENEGSVDLDIVAGTLMSAELLDLFEVDAVGVLASEKGLPERYDDVTKIGEPMKPDLEIVASLEPDVYITDGNLKESLEELFQSTDFEMMYLSNNSYEDVFANIENVGDYLGKIDKGDEIILEMRNKEEEILNTISEEEAPEVLVLFGTPESFMIATPNSYTGSLVEKLGGVNIASDLGEGKPVPYVPFSLETIADLDPDIILRLTHVSPEVSKKAFEEEFAKGFWTNLDAVKNEQVYDLNPDYFGVTANMRVMNALEELAEILYN